MRGLIFICLLISQIGVSQVKITGKTLHYLTQKKVKLSQINIIDLQTDEKRSVVLSNGKYKIKLDIGKIFQVEYTKKGYYTKYVHIDTRGVPEKGRVSMYIDMDMVEEIDGFDASVFEQPMGVAQYNAEIDDMEWNVTYSREVFNEVDKAFKAANVRMKGPQPKDTTESVDEEDQFIFLDPKNPFMLSKNIYRELDGIEIKSSCPPVDWKGLLYSGIVFGNMSLDLDDSAVVSNLGNLSGAAKSFGIGGINFRNYMDRLNAAKDENARTDALGDLYFEFTDSVRDMVVAKNRYVEIGGWIEIFYQAATAYQTDSTYELNKFIGESHKDLGIIIEYLDAFNSELTDAELSFLADLKKLYNSYDDITTKTGEQMQEDEKRLIYKIPDQSLTSLLSQVTQIRNNILKGN